MDRLARACGASGLSVVLLRALEGSPWQARLPPDLLDALWQRRRRHTARQELVRQALQSVAGRFRSANQPFVLLKGPYLAARFYGDVLGREFADLDVLVPHRDRARAGALLEESGYRRRSATVLGATITSFFVHAFDYAAGAACVDLHWGVTRHASVRLDERKLWTRLRRFDVDGAPYDVLDEEHEVIFAALSLLRDIERARPKMKNVVDLIQILASVDAELDWSSLFTAVDGTARPLVNVLALCLDVADAHDLTPRLAQALAAERARRVFCRDTGSAMLFRPAPLGIGNKLWAARAYDSSLPAWLLWWAASLPFRMAVHRGHAAGRPPAHGDSYGWRSRSSA